jgi:hypothetical protein
MAPARMSLPLLHARSKRKLRLDVKTKFYSISRPKNLLQNDRFCHFEMNAK